MGSKVNTMSISISRSVQNQTPVSGAEGPLPASRNRPSSDRMTVEFESQPNSPTNKTLIATIHRLNQGYDRWMRVRLGQSGSGVTQSRLKLLLLLQAHGPQKMGSLAKASGVAARTITTFVDALEKEGLVRRCAHTSDRRATVIEITSAGTALADASSGAYWAANDFLLDNLSERERLVLQDICSRLVEKVEAALAAHKSG